MQLYFHQTKNFFNVIVLIFFNSLETTDAINEESVPEESIRANSTSEVNLDSTLSINNSSNCF